MPAKTPMRVDTSAQLRRPPLTAQWRPDTTNEHPPGTSQVASSPTAWPTYREYRTPAELRSVFACLWVKNCAVHQTQHWRTIPNGHSELAWHSETRELVLNGPGQAVTVGVDNAGQFAVGMRIRPEHTAWFAGVPADEIVGDSVPLTTLHRSRWRAASQRMAQAATPQEALMALLAEIRKAELVPGTADPVVRSGLSQLRWTPRVGGLGAQSHYSERAVRRRFRHETGLAPKTMQKVLRFQYFLALVAMQRERALPLSVLAAQCGYADQAHLSRECVTWSGLPPRRLLMDLALYCWPYHDHAASFGHIRRSAGLA